MQVRAIDHLVLNVRDVQASAAWYCRVLGMRREEAVSASGGPGRTMVKFGNQKMNIRPIATGQDGWFTASNPAVGSEDLCFLVDSPPEDVLKHLRKVGVPVEEGPVTKQGALGPITSVYCRDPDGSLIEIASYGNA